MSQLLKCISPIDGSVFAGREVLSLEVAQEAVVHARAAQANWAARPLAERVELVMAGVAAIGEMNDEIAPELAHMMSAAAMGATAFQKGLGAIHALSHPVGATFNTHHGTTNAVCMPAVLEFNASEIADRFDRVAGYLGIEGGFKGFQRFVQDFNDSFEIPRKLSEMGVSADQMDALVGGAIKDPSCGGNPVELTRENLRQLFEDVI